MLAGLGLVGGPVAPPGQPLIAYALAGVIVILIVVLALLLV